MKTNLILNLAVCATFAGALHGQPRNANVNGPNGDQGKCTIEVTVDGAAEIEIRGTSGMLRNISGQPAQWRRFVCTSAMPANPANFAFKGIDGRGRQTLVRDPRNGGVAVISIEDRDNGSEGYTFDLLWDARGQDGYRGAGNNAQQNQYPQGSNNYPQGYNNGNNGGPQGRNNGNNGNNGWNTNSNYDRERDDEYRPNYRDGDYNKRYNHGFAKEEAIRVCQTQVLREANNRFRGTEIHFGRTFTEDNPGREDWVSGMIDVHRGQREERYRFSCSVDFTSGQVRSAEVERRPVMDSRY